MSRLVMCYGLPGSGKTTWAKAWVARSKGLVKRVNKDDLREMIDCSMHSRSNEADIIALRNKIISHYLARGYDVVVDDTNLNPGHAIDLRALAGVNTVFETKRFNTPLEICLERNAKRDKPVPEKAIRDMYDKYLA